MQEYAAAGSRLRGRRRRHAIRLLGNEWAGGGRLFVEECRVTQGRVGFGGISH